MEGDPDPFNNQIYSEKLIAAPIAVHGHQPNITTTDADNLFLSDMKTTANPSSLTDPAIPESMSFDALQGPGYGDIAPTSPADMAGHSSAVLDPAGLLKGVNQHQLKEKRQQQSSEEPVDAMSCLLQVASINTRRHNNLHLIDDETLIMACGSVVMLVHIPTKQQRYLAGRDGGGIAAIAVHPSRQHFLVAEKCKTRPPNM